MEISTLGDLWNHGAELRLSCAKPRREGLKSVQACTFRCDLDLRTLICTRGRDFPVSMLGSRMRCPRCGYTPAVVMVSLPPAEGRGRVGMVG